MEGYYGKEILLLVPCILFFFVGKLWARGRDVSSYEEDFSQLCPDGKREHHYIVRNVQEFFPILWGGLCASCGITILMPDIQSKILAGILFILPCLIGVLNILVWKMEVRGENILYRSTFGKVRHYQFSQITHGCYKKSGAFRVYSGKKRLFTFDDNVSYETFVGELYARNIPIDTLGGTHFATRRNRIAASFSTLVLMGVFSSLGMIVGLLFLKEGIVGFSLWGVILFSLSLLFFSICYFHWIDVEDERLTLKSCFRKAKTVPLSSITSYRQKKVFGLEFLFLFVQKKVVACVPMNYPGATWLLAKIQKRELDRRKS